MKKKILITIGAIIVLGAVVFLIWTKCPFTEEKLQQPKQEVNIQTNEELEELLNDHAEEEGGAFTSEVHISGKGDIFWSLGDNIKTGVILSPEFWLMDVAQSNLYLIGGIPMPVEISLLSCSGEVYVAPIGFHGTEISLSSSSMPEDEKCLVIKADFTKECEIEEGCLGLACFWNDEGYVCWQ